jgi:hypothetical protein
MGWIQIRLTHAIFADEIGAGWCCTPLVGKNDKSSLKT